MPLNLPEYPFRVKKDDARSVIYDRLRKRWVTLTPEEWVRQHFVEYLIAERGFPAALMGNEVSINLNGVRRRCDTVVADRMGCPLVIVEYKAPEVTITQATFDQIVRYNMVLRARYLIVSNGMTHYCCRICYEDSSYVFLKEVPRYEQLDDSLRPDAASS